MISLRAHNVLDYVIGAVLVACPYVFGFSSIDAARTVFLVLGFSLVTYSLCTKYQYSIFKWIAVDTHMGFDVALGIGLMLAPSIFGYGGMLTGGQLALHFILGFGAVGLVALTRVPRIRGSDVSMRTSSTGTTGLRDSGPWSGPLATKPAQRSTDEKPKINRAA